MSAVPDTSKLIVTKDDRDWLLELGRRQGDSRIMTSTHSVPQGLIKQFRPPSSSALTLPWHQMHESVRFMPGKVSIWSGPTFSGKTQFLRQLMLHALKEGHKVLFVSLEEEPDDVWREFICAATLTRSPTPNQVEWCCDAWAGRLFVFDSTEMIDPELLMGIIRFAVERHGITHVVVDSLMRLGMRIDDFDGQREMGNMLGRCARLSKAHIHLVAHPRKTANSRAPMDLYDIRGAQDIVAQADLVLTLERKQDEPFDSMLTIWKQRGDVNWIGQVRLFHHKLSRQLLYSRSDDPVKYLPAGAYGPLEL